LKFLHKTTSRFLPKWANAKAQFLDSLTQATQETLEEVLGECQRKLEGSADPHTAKEACDADVSGDARCQWMLCSRQILGLMAKNSKFPKATKDAFKGRISFVNAAMKEFKNIKSPSLLRGIAHVISTRPYVRLFIGGEINKSGTPVNRHLTFCEGCNTQTRERGEDGKYMYERRPVQVCPKCHGRCMHCNSEGISLTDSKRNVLP